MNQIAKIRFLLFSYKNYSCNYFDDEFIKKFYLVNNKKRNSEEIYEQIYPFGSLLKFLFSIIIINVKIYEINIFFRKIYFVNLFI